jgi:hypothetical protein
VGVLGDSKSLSTETNDWGAQLIPILNAANNAAGIYFVEDTPRNWAVGSSTIAIAESSIDSWLLSHTVNARNDHNIFFLNWGINEIENGGIVEANWKASYLYVIDAIRTKYANAEIYITKPWGRGYTADCNTLAGYIDAIVAARSTFCHVGDDERTWLEGGDDGATNTRDGIHYSDVAGQTAKVTAIRAVLGY